MPRKWLEELLEFFPKYVLDAGDYEVVHADTIPSPYRRILDHEHHMTVTLEEHCGCLVHLKVVDVHRKADDYARQLTLTAGPDGPNVLAGIMRFNLSQVSDEIREEIVAAKTPLGRLLIEHGVLRRLQPSVFLKIKTTSPFGELLGLDDNETERWPETYGRLALIFCNDQPAVELLEVVTPTL